MHTNFQVSVMNMSGDMGKTNLQEKRTDGLTDGRTDWGFNVTADIYIGIVLYAYTIPSVCDEYIRRYG